TGGVPAQGLCHGRLERARDRRGGADAPAAPGRCAAAPRRPAARGARAAQCQAAPRRRLRPFFARGGMDADGRGRGRVSARERPFTVPPDTVRNQRAASDPRASAWVAANAGSGKTFVLTQRVLRLLLDGAAPGSILCLTYTKAAAAEMRHRVSVELGRWARMDDAALMAALDGLTGTQPDAEALARARTLFAHAL